MAAAQAPADDASHRPVGGMSVHLQDHEIMDIYVTRVVLTRAGEIL